MMKNKNLDVKKIITQINRLYTSYQSLSNDELRNTLSYIKNSHKDLENQECLNSILPEIYALVKETARRFSKGNIIVTANLNDIELAKQFDFVRIEGDKAIFSNTWFARGNSITWDMVHYDEQLMAGIYLHYGYATEMATGEGKTLVATLPVFLNALSHKGVHVMTVNDYLSQRDCELTRPIYMFHGLSVDCLEYTNCQYNKRRKQAYDADITFGTNSSFIFDYLYDHIAMSSEDCVQNNHNFAIIDELDSILIDNANIPHVISSGSGIIPHENDFQKYAPIVKELLSITNPILYKKYPIRKKVVFTKHGKIWLEKKSNKPNLFKVKRKSEISGFKSLREEEKKEIEDALYLQNVFNQLLKAYAVIEKDVDYIVNKGRVIIIDEHTGRLKESSRWEHGLHIAVEVKENINKMLYDGGQAAVISLKNYYKLYHRFCGMSGTICLAANELRKVYNLKVAHIPTHQPVIRIDKPFKIYKTKEAKDKAIVNEIEKLHFEKRPVLVGCLSIKRAEEISNLLNERGLPHNLLSAKSLDKEAFYIWQAGASNKITVSTSIAGRGTDIKLSTEAKLHGGLAIVGTDLFDSKRIDDQLKGRAGRQGDPGSSQFFVSLEDAIIKNLSDNDLKELNKNANKITDEALPYLSFIDYVHKAQSNIEHYYYKQRRDVAYKDDLIAPFRKQFYDQRNSILFNPHVVNDIIKSLIKDNTELQAIDKHIEKQYLLARTLLNKELKNNSQAIYLSIPFSENMHLFTVKFMIKETINNPIVFSNEYKRQVILGAYDKYWIRFVMHIMEDLNKKEIELLPKEFEEMRNDIDFIILSRLKYSTIPVKSKPEQEENINNNPQETCNASYLNSDDQCPCGSGKKFGECHGRNIRQRKARRF